MEELVNHLMPRGVNERGLQSVKQDPVQFLHVMLLHLLQWGEEEEEVQQTTPNKPHPLKRLQWLEIKLALSKKCTKQGHIYNNLYKSELRESTDVRFYKYIVLPDIHVRYMK